jgi:hypothetical protein
LNTAAPVIGNAISVEAMFEINRALVDIVAVWEKQNSPVGVERQHSEQRQFRDQLGRTMGSHLLGK